MRQIRSLFLLVIFWALPAIGASEEQRNSDGLPFYITAKGSGFPIVSTLYGTFRVHSDSIELRLKFGDIAIEDTSVYKGRRVLFSLTVALASNSQKVGWKTVDNWVEVSRINKVMKPGEHHRIAPVRFTIPIDRSIDLTQDWLVASVDSIAIDLPDNVVGLSYAHSDRHLFSPSYEPEKANRILEFVGSYGNVRTTDTGHCYGYAVSLWKYRTNIIGLMNYHSGLCGDPPIGELQNVRYSPQTGDIKFSSRFQDELLTFEGVLSEKEISGTMSWLGDKNHAIDSSEQVILTRDLDRDSSSEDFLDYSSWEKYWAPILKRRGP